MTKYESYVCSLEPFYHSFITVRLYFFVSELKAYVDKKSVSVIGVKRGGGGLQREWEVCQEV